MDFVNIVQYFSMNIFLILYERFFSLIVCCGYRYLLFVVGIGIYCLLWV